MTDRGGAFHPIVELTLARLRDVLREPEAVFWVFVFPILLAIGLGVAFPSRSDQPVPIGLVEGPGQEATRAALSTSPSVRLRMIDRATADIALRDGVVQLVVIPGVPPTYRFDPTRAESRLARLLADEALQRAAGRANAWEAREERVVAPGSRYVDWLVPGLVGMNVMGTGLWMVGYSVVQARAKKLLRRLVASPMRRGHYLLSHLLARLVFLIGEVGVLLLFARLALGMPMRGSVAMLAAVVLLGAIAFGGLGLLMASRAKTVEAASGLINAATLPMWVFSGVFFSAANFPAPAQPFIQALPLTALNDALRAVLLDGAGPAAIGVEAAILGVWTVVTFAVALRIFRWE